MPELIRTRCAQGKLIITDTHIIVELGSIKSSAMPRSSFTTIDMKMTMWAGPWSSYRLVFHGAGAERLKASMVKAKDAKRIKALLTGR